MFKKLFLFITLFTGYIGAAEPQNLIYMVSLGGDNIGNNGTYVLDDQEGLFFVEYIQPVNQKDQYRGNGFSLYFDGGVANRWTVDMVAPFEQSLEAGKEYVAAQTFPNQSPRKPGIRITKKDHWADNLQGSFKVLEFKVDQEGKIQALAVDFRQISQDNGILLGSIRYQSAIPANADLYTLNERFPLEFYMESQQKDYIGQGQSYHYTQEFMPFFQKKGTLAFTVEGWNVNFSTPDGQPFKRGIYKNARRNPFRDGHPGIEIYGHGRGCNQIDGSFQVHEIEYDSKGRIIVLAMDFRQVCDGRGVLKGGIRYNSNFPTPEVSEESKPLEIMMQSSGGYIGQGKNYELKSESKPLFAGTDFGKNHVLSFSVEGFDLTFVPPQGKKFEQGKYLEAERFPFQNEGHPAMDISGNGRGCNRVEGEFEILEIAYNEDGEITTLAMNFIHYCEGGRLYPITGTVRYNSNIPHEETEYKIVKEETEEEDCGCNDSDESFSSDYSSSRSYSDFSSSRSYSDFSSSRSYWDSSSSSYSDSSSSRSDSDSSLDFWELVRRALLKIKR